MLREIRPAIVLVIAHGDHRPRLSAGHDRHCGRPVPEPGPRQPDRTRRQGGGLRPDRPGIHQRALFPWPALGDHGPDPQDSTKTVPAPYNAANSGGSNLGPTNKALIERVQGDLDKLKEENPSAAVPIDLVTTSGSGLDPDISPEGALFQVPRIAKARNLPEDRVRQIVNENIQRPLIGVIGEPRVNVLALNLALDKLAPK